MVLSRRVVVFGDYVIEPILAYVLEIKNYYIIHSTFESFNKFRSLT